MSRGRNDSRAASVPTFVVDEGDLRKYRTETPNMVLDMDLGPYEGWLYQHLKRIAGDSGVCWRGTQALARITKMSTGAVSKAKLELQKRGLITVQPGDGRKGEADEIRITNIWRRNFEHFDNSHGQSPSPEPEVYPPSPGEHKKELSTSTETSPKGDAKKPTASPTPRRHRGKVKKLSEEEIEERWEALCASDPHGDDLRKLAELLAAENKTGEVSVGRLWNELGERYLKNRQREDLSEEAWSYGFEIAISRQKPSIGYVMPCARGYRPSTGGGSVTTTASPIAATPDVGIQALANYVHPKGGPNDLRRFASVAERFDFSGDADPDWRIMRELDDDQTILSRVRSVVRSAVREAEAG